MKPVVEISKVCINAVTEGKLKDMPITVHGHNETEKVNWRLQTNFLHVHAVVAINIGWFPSLGLSPPMGNPGYNTAILDTIKQLLMSRSRVYMIKLNLCFTVYFALTSVVHDSGGRGGGGNTQSFKLQK